MLTFVIPVQTGIHIFQSFPWIPAFAGMTGKNTYKSTYYA